MKKMSAFAIAIVLSCAVVMAQNSERSRQSLKGIRALGVIVEDPSWPLVGEGLTTNQLQTDVELRLRTAGIKILKKEELLNRVVAPYLHVEVNSGKLGTLSIHAYDIRVSLFQDVMLRRNPAQVCDAITWHIGLVGKASSGDMRIIRENLADLVDQFINASLSVNPK